jgi:hypothetical protein
MTVPADPVAALGFKWEAAEAEIARVGETFEREVSCVCSRNLEPDREGDPNQRGGCACASEAARGGPTISTTRMTRSTC